jgi:5-methylcytosine-specific restriction endonuclease McrA
MFESSVGWLGSIRATWAGPAPRSRAAQFRREPAMVRQRLVRFVPGLLAEHYREVVTDVVTLDAPTTDRYADILTRVASSLAAGDFDNAEFHLEPIVDDRWLGHVAAALSQERDVREKASRAVSDRLRAEVFLRDAFRCTYCGGRAVPRCLLVAISEVFPRFGYDLHYRRGLMHPAFWALAPEADHTVAHRRGGAGALENLTTLHALCNTAKSDGLVDKLPVVPQTKARAGWDGLMSTYPLIVQAGNTHGARRSSPSYHRKWLRLFGLEPLGPVVAPGS